MASRRAITRKEVKHMALLARIELSRSEEELFTEQLGKVLEYFKLIDKVDTKNLEPTYHVLDLSNVFREDEVKPSSQDLVIKCAPNLKGRYVKAPKIT